MMTQTRHKGLWLAVIAAIAAGVAIWWFVRPNAAAPTVSEGKLDRYPKFHSQYVTARDVAVWTPADYQVGEPCDVLYMHDGQMLFDPNTTWNGQEWRVDEVVAGLIAHSAIRRCIVVAIDNNSDLRLKEYFPDNARDFLPTGLRATAEKDGLLGNNYLKFVVEELKPFIDEHYRPLTGREHTFMMGSSMGGLISLYAICEYPQVFGGVACMSSHLSFARLDLVAGSEPWAEAFCDYVSAHLPQVDNCKIYMDRGTVFIDAEYGPYQQRLDSVFMAQSQENRHFVSLTFDGHEHNETCWAERLDEPLRFLLGTKSNR